MIRVNLLPIKEAEFALRRRQQLSVAALAASLALLAMVVPYAFQKRTLMRLQTRVEEIEAEIRAYDEQVKEARDLEAKRNALQERLRIIRDLNSKRVGPARVLADLSMAVPEKLWIEDFTEKQGEATIVGWALDNQTIAVFMRQLDASPYFFNVDLSEATQPDGQGGGSAKQGPMIRLKKFVLKAKLDYFGGDGKGTASSQGTQHAPGAA